MALRFGSLDCPAIVSIVSESGIPAFSNDARDLIETRILGTETLTP